MSRYVTLSTLFTPLENGEWHCSAHRLRFAEFVDDDGAYCLECAETFVTRYNREETARAERCTDNAWERNR